MSDARRIDTPISKPLVKIIEHSSGLTRAPSSRAESAWDRREACTYRGAPSRYEHELLA